MNELVKKIGIMSLAVLLHLILFIGFLLICLEMSHPWLIQISASVILSQLFFTFIIIISLVASFFSYIKIGQLIIKKLS